MGNIQLNSGLCKCLGTVDKAVTIDDRPIQDTTNKNLPVIEEKLQEESYFNSGTPSLVNDNQRQFNTNNILSENDVISKESIKHKYNKASRNENYVHNSENSKIPCTNGSLVVEEELIKSGRIQHEDILICENPKIVKRNQPLEIIKENTAGSQNYISEGRSSQTHFSTNKLDNKIKLNKTVNQSGIHCRGKSFIRKKEIENINKELAHLSFLLNSNSNDILLHGQLYKLIINENAQSVQEKNAYSYAKKFFTLSRTEFKFYNSKENYIKSYSPKFCCDVRHILMADKLQDEYFNLNFVKKFKIKNRKENQNFHFFIKLCEDSQRDEVDNVLIFASEKNQIVDKWITFINYIVNFLSMNT